MWFANTKVIHDRFRPILRIIIYQSNITNHYTVINLSKLKLSNHCNNKPNRKIIKRINLRAVGEKLVASNVSRILNSKDTNLAIEYILENIIKDCTHKIEVQKSEIKRKEWITSGLIVTVNKKQQLL